MVRNILDKKITVVDGHAVIRTSIEEKLTNSDLQNSIYAISRQMQDIENQVTNLVKRYNELKAEKASLEDTQKSIAVTPLPEIQK